MAGRRQLALVLGLALALAAAQWLVFGAAQRAAAGGLVTDCSSDAQLIQALGGGGTVSFSCGSATITLGATQTITQNTTIDGGNQIALSGGGARRLFVVNSGAALTLTNITIRDGHASADGGAIASHGTLVIQGSGFYSNTTDTGFSGGAIESFGALIINGSEFAHNSAGNGGVLFSREATSLTSISRSSFHENYTTNSTNGWGGAALVWNGAQLTIISSTLAVNTGRSGGALYITSLSAVTLTNSAITGGLAITGGAVYGALGSKLLADGSRLDANLALQVGGGLYNAGIAFLQNGTSLNGNQAQDGAGLYNVGGVLTESTQFNANIAAGNGGGIYTSGSSTALFFGVLAGNSAKSGGGVYALDSLSLENMTVLQNVATTSAGGGVYANSSLHPVVLTNVLLDGNHADSLWGGGMANQGSALLNSVTFVRNRAATNGGALGNSGTLYLSYANIRSNSAVSGGGINNFGSGDLHGNDLTLSDNSAGADGGGLDNVGTATFLNSTFSGNRAGAGGGLHSGGPLSLENVTVANNTATQGGGLFFDLSSVVALTNTILAYSPSGGNCAGNAINSSKFTFSSDVTCGLPGGNTIKGNDPNGLDPQLSALGNYGGVFGGALSDPLLTHMPKATSPAVDGIVGSDAPLVDERGLTRPSGAGYDIGAVERQTTDSDLAPRLYLPLIIR